ncbi:MAG: hypothetical protein GH145_05245 [Firmicutes bacterium]|nr:hypothetical protein [Bacillota bacterium]
MLDDLYDLGKSRVALSREFNQSSCGIQDFRVGVDMKSITKAKIVMCLLGGLMIWLGFDVVEIVISNRETIVVGLVGILLFVWGFTLKKS